VDLQVETIVALAAHDNIAGLKDSGVSVVRAARVLAAAPDFLVFSGTGSALIPFLSLGGAGGIMALANIAPAALRELMETFKAGDGPRAASLQVALAEINTAITSRYGVPGLKHAMERVGLYGGPPRAPLQPLPDAAAREIDRLIETANIPTLK
jgi:4-hydroxy-2-oxoglutarate aldolase